MAGLARCRAKPRGSYAARCLRAFVFRRPLSLMAALAPFTRLPSSNLPLAASASHAAHLALHPASESSIHWKTISTFLPTIGNILSYGFQSLELSHFLPAVFQAVSFRARSHALTPRGKRPLHTRPPMSRLAISFDVALRTHRNLLLIRRR